MWRLPDQEGETSRAVGDLIVNPEMLLGWQEDGGDLETSRPDCPPDSVCLTVETINTKYRVVPQQRDHYTHHITSHHITVLSIDSQPNGERARAASGDDHQVNSTHVLR